MQNLPSECFRLMKRRINSTVRDIESALGRSMYSRIYSLLVRNGSGHRSLLLRRPLGRSLRFLFDGFLLGQRYLIIDRDTKYCDAFVRLLEDAGTKIVRLPARSPNLNAHAERFVRTIKEECLGQLILFSERSLRHAINQYLEHYHDERPHQGIGNRPPLASAAVPRPARIIDCRQRLGGLLRSYRGLAA